MISDVCIAKIYAQTVRQATAAQLTSQHPRRISLIVFSAEDVWGTAFCLIFASFDKAMMSRKSSLLN
ncbi:hypothetical protein DK867_24735 [Ochrobactrum sp. POC9]|nr:hypothetical protein DK867_24735 [Ochrobactrum sp. POC9]